MASDWWGDWRPTLPTHTGNLKPTDLIECTSIVGGLPVNTAITGQQIINAASGTTAWGAITGTLSSQTDLQSALNAKQDTLVSGTNIKTVNSTSLLGSGNITIASSPYTLVGSAVGSTITNTTSNMSSASILVPANTMVNNQQMQIRTRYVKTSGTTSSTARIYVNTNNSLAGASLVATCTSQTTAAMINFQRDFLLTGTFLAGYSFTLPGITDTAASAPNTLASFNPAVNQYIIFAIQNTSISDIAQFLKVNVMIY